MLYPRYCKGAQGAARMTSWALLEVLTTHVIPLPVYLQTLSFYLGKPLSQVLLTSSKRTAALQVQSSTGNHTGKDFSLFKIKL